MPMHSSLALSEPLCYINPGRFYTENGDVHQIHITGGIDREASSMVSSGRCSGDGINYGRLRKQFKHQYQ